MYVLYVYIYIYSFENHPLKFPCRISSIQKYPPTTFPSLPFVLYILFFSSPNQKKKKKSNLKGKKICPPPYLCPKPNQSNPSPPHPTISQNKIIKKRAKQLPYSSSQLHPKQRIIPNNENKNFFLKGIKRTSPRAQQ